MADVAGQAARVATKGRLFSGATQTGKALNAVRQAIQTAGGGIGGTVKTLGRSLGSTAGYMAAAQSLINTGMATPSLLHDAVDTAGGVGANLLGKEWRYGSGSLDNPEFREYERAGRKNVEEAQARGDSDLGDTALQAGKGAVRFDPGADRNSMAVAINADAGTPEAQESFMRRERLKHLGLPYEWARNMMMGRYYLNAMRKGQSYPGDRQEFLRRFMVRPQVAEEERTANRGTSLMPGTIYMKDVYGNEFGTMDEAMKYWKKKYPNMMNVSQRGTWMKNTAGGQESDPYYYYAQGLQYVPESRWGTTKAQPAIDSKSAVDLIQRGLDPKPFWSAKTHRRDILNPRKDETVRVVPDTDRGIASSTRSIQDTLSPRSILKTLTESANKGIQRPHFDDASL